MIWQPIETVPKIVDGESVLLSNGHKVWEDWRVLVATFEGGEIEIWMNEDHWAAHEKATHWGAMPLPPNAVMSGAEKK